MSRRKGKKGIVLSSFLMKKRNADVVSKLRKSGLFETNEEVLDAALRVLVEKMKSEFSPAEEAKIEENLAEAEGLPTAPPRPDGDDSFTKAAERFMEDNKELMQDLAKAEEEEAS